MSSQLARPDTEILDEIMHLVFEENKTMRQAPSDREPVALIPESRLREFLQALRAASYTCPPAFNIDAPMRWHGIRIYVAINVDEIIVRL